MPRDRERAASESRGTSPGPGRCGEDGLGGGQQGRGECVKPQGPPDTLYRPGSIPTGPASQSRPRSLAAEGLKAGAPRVCGPT